MALSKDSVMGVFILTGGLRKGYRAAVYVVSFLIACDREGKRLSVAEYGAYWRQSEATTIRERGALRASLPEGIDPDDFLDRMYASAAARRALTRGQVEGVAGLSTFPFPAVC